MAPPLSPFPPHSRAPGSLRGCWGALWLPPRSLTLHRAAPAPLLPTWLPPRQEELQRCPGRALSPSPLTGHRDRHPLTAHWHGQCQIQEDGTWHSHLPGMALRTLPLPMASGCWGTGTLWSRHRTVGEEGDGGCPGGAGRVTVGMGFGAKSKPCTGPAEQQGRTLPTGGRCWC